MDKQDDIVLKLGETRIVDEDGHTLLTVELTQNMLVVIGADGTVIQRSWRDVLKWAEHQAEPSTPASSQLPIQSREEFFANWQQTLDRMEAEGKIRPASEEQAE